MSGRVDIIRYYSEAGQDYQAWSPNFNMHFGYWRRGLNPLCLEPMLEEMSAQALSRLRLRRGPRRVVDLGCGLGASARRITRHRPELRVECLTIVAWQTAHARDLMRVHGLAQQVQLVQGDYCAAPMRPASYDGAYAIESMCHAHGYHKADFVAEAMRLLKPGARLVVIDGFLRHTRPMNPLFRWCYRKVCDNWAVETFAHLDSFIGSLRNQGFSNIQVEELSWRIVPSVLHIPLVTAAFLGRELRRTGLRMGEVRWGHLVACVLSPIVGAARTRFGYFAVTAERRDG